MRVEKNIKGEENSGCDRPKLWQVHCKLVGTELTALNANKVLGKLPGTTSWAFTMLMRHRSEI